MSGYADGLLLAERRHRQIARPALHPLVSLDERNAVVVADVQLHYGENGSRILHAGTRVNVIHADEYLARISTGADRYAVVSRNSVILDDDVRTEP